MSRLNTQPASDLAAGVKLPPLVLSFIAHAVSFASPRNAAIRLRALVRGNEFFLIPLACVIGVVAGLVVLVQRRRHRSRLAGDDDTKPPSEPSATPANETAKPSAPPIERVVATAPPIPAPQPAPPPVGTAATLKINLLGPLNLGELDSSGVGRVIVELLVYLACHDHRHLRVGQIQIGFRPVSSGRPEIAEKTLRNYLSELRQWVGAAHLPESSAKEGYLLHDVELDWATLLRLSRQADASGGADAIELRTEALALVRGRPFEGLLDDGFDWVEAEHLYSQMAGVIATCAVRLANDHLEAKDFAAAEQAAWAGRRGAPEDSGPWLVGAQALSALGDRSALNRWMKDAAVDLDPEDVERIWRSLPPHQDPSST